MRRGNRVMTAVATLGAVTVVAACGSGSKSSTSTGAITQVADSPVSVAKIRQAADKLVDEPQGPCPLGLDVSKALQQAGISRTATAGTDSQTVPDAEGESAKSEKRYGAEHKGANDATVLCRYTLSGGGYVVVTLLSAEQEGKALEAMGPYVNPNSQLSHEQVTGFVLQKLNPGKGVVTLDGVTAVVKVDVKDGDAVLGVRSVDARNSMVKGPIIGEPLRKLSEVLAGQVSL